MWLRGVTISTLDSESSDRGSNPREALTRTTVCFAASYDQREGRAAWSIAGAPRGGLRNHGPSPCMRSMRYGPRTDPSVIVPGGWSCHFWHNKVRGH